MVRRFLPARAGITLIEVLAAIFIMGVGLLALFTLFPLGALSMARAVRDDRAATIAGNAASMATAMDLRNDPAVLTAFNTVPAPFPAPDPLGPGYPVLVDPTYAALGAPPLGFLVGVTPGIQRCGASYAVTPTNIARWFTFQEEMTFEKTGQPKGGGTSVERPGTYTWSYLLRRPKSSRPDLIEMSVLVYASRAVETADGEAVFTGVAGAKGTNSLSFSYPAGAKPNMRRGAWIMDVSFVQRTDAVTGKTTGTVNGFAYRVENVTDTGATNLTLEVDPALKADVTSLVVLENVIAVVNRSTTWKP
jgi:Tfp pilus assembly protein PilV